MARTSRTWTGQKESEHGHQVALFQWAAMMQSKVPELDKLFAIPNGGNRHIAVAVKLKAEGVRAGVPDIMLPVARFGYHGLFVEMKLKGNKPTAIQKEWHEKLEHEGYKVVVCYYWHSAREIIEAYLGMDRI